MVYTGSLRFFESLAVGVLTECYGLHRFFESLAVGVLTECYGLHRFFESLAVGVLTECYVEDERKAQLLLTRDLANFGNKTVLRLAKEADNKLFLANVACQSLLDRIWMGRMALNNGWLKVS